MKISFDITSEEVLALFQGLRTVLSKATSEVSAGQLLADIQNVTSEFVETAKAVVEEDPASAHRYMDPNEFFYKLEEAYLGCKYVPHYKIVSTLTEKQLKVTAEDTWGGSTGRVLALGFQSSDGCCYEIDVNLLQERFLLPKVWASYKDALALLFLGRRSLWQLPLDLALLAGAELAYWKPLLEEQERALLTNTAYVKQREFPVITQERIQELVEENRQRHLQQSKSGKSSKKLMATVVQGAEVTGVPVEESPKVEESPNVEESPKVEEPEVSVEEA
jgi:hypothetical protein